MRYRFFDVIGPLPGQRCRDAAGELVGTFSPSHEAKQAGEDLHVFNSTGEHVATVHGAAHTAETDDATGALRIFRRRKTTDGRLLSERLHDLNARHEEFYRRRS